MTVDNEENVDSVEKKKITGGIYFLIALWIVWVLTALVALGGNYIALGVLWGLSGISVSIIILMGSNRRYKVSAALIKILLFLILPATVGMTIYIS